MAGRRSKQGRRRLPRADAKAQRGGLKTADAAEHDGRAQPPELRALVLCHAVPLR